MLAKILPLAALITLAVAQETDFCAIMCQPKKSSTHCQNLLDGFERNAKLSYLNFYCCLTDAYHANHNNYFLGIKLDFRYYLFTETDPDKLKNYAICIRRCSKDGIKLSKEDCDVHIQNKYSTCSLQTCLPNVR